MFNVLPVSTWMGLYYSDSGIDTLCFVCIYGYSRDVKLGRWLFEAGRAPIEFFKQEK